MQTNIFYHKFLEESSIVSITDKTGKIIYVNDKFCEISKYSRAELIGRDHEIINSGFHSKEFFTNMWSTISEGQTWRGEVCNKSKDGEIYWVDSFIKPEIDSNGNISRYYSFRILITEKKDEEKKRTEETISKIANFFTNSIDFHFFINKQQKLVTSNKYAFELIINKNGVEFGNDSSVSTRSLSKLLPDFKANFNSALTGIEVFLEQEVDFFKKGIKSWYSVTYSPINHSLTQIIGVAVTAKDISKRKEAEIKLKTAFKQNQLLIDSMCDAVVYKDETGRWLITNYAARKLFNLKGNNWRNKTNLELIDIYPRFKKLWKDEFMNDEAAWLQRDLHENSLSFNTQHLMVKRYPVFNIDGSRKSMILVCKDVTISKERNKKIAKQANQLARIAWLQAHKARAPVARILGLANIINLSDKNDPLNDNILSKLVENANELDSVIRKISNYTELNSNFTIPIHSNAITSNGNKFNN
jgi:PAS domain S-box-containing protein